MEGEEFVFNVSGSEDPLKILSKSVTWWELHGWHTHVGRAVQIVQCYLRTLAELVFPSPLIDLQPRRGSQAETAFTSSLAVRSKHMCVFVYVFVCVCVWKGGRQTKRKNPEEREGVKEIIIRRSWAICIRKQALPCQWDWHQMHLHVYDWFTCHGIYKEEFSVKLEKFFPPCVLHILHFKKFLGHTTHHIVPQPGLEPMPLACYCC